MIIKWRVPGHDGLGQEGGGRRGGRLQERHRAGGGQLQAVPEVSRLLISCWTERSAVTWLVNIQGDVRDQQDCREGGHQVKVDVPQVATQVTVQVPGQDLLWGLQGLGSINHPVSAKRKSKMIVYSICYDNIIRCGFCLSRPNMTNVCVYSRPPHKWSMIVDSKITRGCFKWSQHALKSFF